MPRGATDHPEESVIEVYATLLKRLADAVDVSLHRSGIHYAPFYRHSCLPNRLSISLLLHHCDIAHWRNSTDKRTQKISVQQLKCQLASLMDIFLSL